MNERPEPIDMPKLAINVTCDTGGPTLVVMLCHLAGQRLTPVVQSMDETLQHLAIV